VSTLRQCYPRIGLRHKRRPPKQIRLGRKKQLTCGAPDKIRTVVQERAKVREMDEGRNTDAAVQVCGNLEKAKRAQSAEGVEKTNTLRARRKGIGAS
jgi:hypothetical protein